MGVGVFFTLIDSLSSTQIVIAITVGLFFHSLMYAPQAAFFCELFGTSVRYSGASIGYQLASVFAGALAMIIAIRLFGEAGDTTNVALYLAVCSAITVVAVWFAKETRGSSLRHDKVLAEAERVRV